MIYILFNCFNSLNFYVILFFVFLLYFVNEKSKQYEINKVKEQLAIDSIERRSEECPQQYPNGWLPICDSHHLKKGEVKPIFALGRDLVIYRGTSGKVYVFDAYCPHLGANLGVGGTVVGEEIKCHFHGWQFDNQGDCTAIPGLEDKSIPKATIRKWRCDEVNDFIYVWHHIDGNEPDWFMNKSDKLETLIYRGKDQIKLYCHIQDIFENEADQAHFDTIHGPQSIIPRFLQNIIETKIFTNPWKACDPPNTHCNQLEFFASLKIFGRTFARFSANLLSIGPANYIADSHVDIGFKLDFTITFNVMTLGPLKQLGVLKLYSEPSIIIFLCGKVILQFNRFIGNQDRPVWNTKRFLRNPVFTKLDEYIVKFRRWYKQFYSDHSKYN